MALKRKRRGSGLEIKTFDGKDGTYLVMKSPSGSYHAFVEIEAKAAAVSCGSNRKSGTPQDYWRALWAKK